MTIGSLLAAVNASLNATSALFLFAGFHAIRRGRRERHRRLMLSAFVASSLFLATYVARWLVTGTVHFAGHGALKVVYLSVLFTHMPLAIVSVPLAVRALQLALGGRFDEHKRVTRWLYPIWAYVSVTGVVVYLMLYHLPIANTSPPGPHSFRQSAVERRGGVRG